MEKVNIERLRKSKDGKDQICDQFESKESSYFE